MRSISDAFLTIRAMPQRGRFAPSPTGDLHLGNLRTALIGYLWARESDGEFLIRMEDLDQMTSSRALGERQLADLAAIGVESDMRVIWQSDRFDIYKSIINELTERGLTYECFCSRREIREAAAAPHGPLPDGAYPGTCADLTPAERSERATERPAAIRLRTDRSVVAIHDTLYGEFSAQVDDVVLLRNDGTPAYNLAVVVDDALQGVTQICRGDDLLSSTPRQVYLQRLLGYPTPEYLHVPLVLGNDGERLSKRNGALSLRDLNEQGRPAESVRELLLASIGGSFSADALLRVGTWTI